MMNETHDFRLYLENLFLVIPSEMLVGGAIILSLGFYFLIKWRGLLNGLRFTALLAFVEYVTLIYCSTVLFRTTRDIQKYDFHPFWSYNDPGLFIENVMNVVAFVPIGLLLGAGIKRLKWWHALLVGAYLSVSIEFLQFVFKKGFSELDDVMHNILGCMMGYGIYKSARLLFDYCYKRTKQKVYI